MQEEPTTRHSTTPISLASPRTQLTHSVHGGAGQVYFMNASTGARSDSDPRDDALVKILEEERTVKHKNSKRPPFIQTHTSQRHCFNTMHNAVHNTA